MPFFNSVKISHKLFFGKNNTRALQRIDKKLGYKIHSDKYSNILSFSMIIKTSLLCNLKGAKVLFS
ncbi:hypothetical protein DMC01_01595 [Campylobacter troglodytis]|nr:hypothetical protein DMC01_01595 [Campylobacter troglodytis]